MKRPTITARPPRIVFVSGHAEPLPYQDGRRFWVVGATPPRRRISAAELKAIISARTPQPDPAGARDNRIPRIAPPRLGLATRLRRACGRTFNALEAELIRRRINALTAEGRELGRTVAYDLAMALVYEIQIAADPVLRSRVAANRARLRTIGEKVQRLQLRLAELELFL